MNLIDQNSALLAQETALIPDDSLIDGRSEIDRLSFLTEFASLINFYDHENKIQGNWSPFLLKDPAILLANISKTKIDKINSLFQHICTQIENIVKEDKIQGELVVGMNNLFEHLIKIFVHIERWTYFMQLAAVDYELKKYVIHEVKNTYSQYFWAILSLKDRLSLVHYRPRIKPVHYYLYDNFDQHIWKQQKDKSPYWEILGLDAAVTDDTKPPAVYNALKNAGNLLIRFLEAIVSFATKEYPVVKALKGKYPDTLLLRAFVDLLGNYTTQLNAISNQHLQFYYQDILKQTLMEPVVDQVLVFADLAKTDSTFILPAGTLLNGGLDAQKKPILFETINDANLNPAKISSIYTIGKYPDSNSLTPIQQIINPAVIQKDENGRSQSFKFFGDTTASTPAIVPFGFVISSPLLYLQEGTRTITLELISWESQQIDLCGCKFYLSTADKWFLIDSSKIIPGDNKITINLVPKDPEIAAFPKNTELLVSNWPMLKIEFDNMNSLTNMLSQLIYPQLSVDVKGAKTLQLFNDYGTVSAKNPYQPFGPTPLIKSNFIIGSNEIFSKPLRSLEMEIDWNNLPDNFAGYYWVYNNYLNGALVHTPWLSRIFRRKTKQSLLGEYFDNQSFTIDFMLLQESAWKSLNMIPDVDPPSVPSTNVNLIKESNTPPQKPLFREDANEVLEDQSFFHLSNPAQETQDWADFSIVDPQIQETPLKFTESSTSGFMRISLGGISYGFGSALYPNVVSQVALYNSYMLYSNSKTLNDLMPAANLPFAPKISQISFNYSAYSDLGNQSPYPYQCYTYSIMGNKALTFTMDVTTATTSNVNEVKADIAPIPINDLLFSATYSGFLFLEMENLIPTESFSIYFDLTIDQNTLNAPARKVTYFYLNDQGWNTLPIVADETFNFSCSGNISLTIPTDISLQKFMGEDEKYWICVAADASSTSFPDIAMLKTNGLMAKRLSGGESIINIPVGSISKSQTAIPQIATITQPFSSFGGTMAEDSSQMNQRVSLRLKTKDRAISPEDYYRLIKKNFETVFYVKTIFDNVNKVNNICVVPNAKNWQDPNALIPLFNQCILDEINDFLAERAGLIPVNVINFDLVPVQISANIKVMSGYTLNGVMNNVNQALILFLSSWIAGNQPKITIDQGISQLEVTTFIQNIPGVVSVNDVSWQDVGNADNLLIVSSANHLLTCTY
jgi:hypothetical protein